MIKSSEKEKESQINSTKQIFFHETNTSMSTRNPKRINCELFKLDCKCCPEQERESYTPPLSPRYLPNLCLEIMEEKVEEEKKCEGGRISLASTRASILLTPLSRGNIPGTPSDEEIKDFGQRALRIWGSNNKNNNKLPLILPSQLEEIKEEDERTNNMNAILLPQIGSGESNSSGSSSSSYFSSIDSEASLKEHYLQISEYAEPQFHKLIALKSQTICLDGIIHKYSLLEDVIEDPNYLKDPAIGKKTILLDLDLTLIHSFFDALPPVGRAFPLIMVNPIFNIVVRKGARKFVHELGKHSEIILYSSGTAIYVQEIINSVKEFKLNIKYLLSREDCHIVKELVAYLKSAKIIENRDPKNIIVVDDSFWAYPEDLDNVIPVRPFVVDKYHADAELEELLLYIPFLLKQADVRPFLRKKYGLQRQFDQKFRLLGGYN